MKIIVLFQPASTLVSLPLFVFTSLALSFSARDWKFHRKLSVWTELVDFSVCVVNFSGENFVWYISSFFCSNSLNYGHDLKFECHFNGIKDPKLARPNQKKSQSFFLSFCLSYHFTKIITAIGAAILLPLLPRALSRSAFFCFGLY